MKMSLTTEERNISNGVQSISRMMLFGCLVAVIFTFAAEAKPATNWPQITRRCVIILWSNVDVQLIKFLNSYFQNAILCNASYNIDILYNLGVSILCTNARVN